MIMSIYILTNALEKQCYLFYRENIRKDKSNVLQKVGKKEY